MEGCGEDGGKGRGREGKGRKFVAGDESGYGGSSMEDSGSAEGIKKDRR